MKPKCLSHLSSCVAPQDSQLVPTCRGSPSDGLSWSWLQCVIGMGFSTGCAMSFCQPDDGHCSSEKKKMRELGRQGE